MREATPPELKPHALIASDRVEGTDVRRASGERLGRIERLMIDKNSGNVAYAVLTFGGLLRFGEKHLPIPWSTLKYDPALNAYTVDLSNEDLAKAPSFAADKEFDWGDRSEEAKLQTRLLQGTAVLGILERPDTSSPDIDSLTPRRAVPIFRPPRRIRCLLPTSNPRCANSPKPRTHGRSRRRRRSSRG